MILAAKWSCADLATNRHISFGTFFDAFSFPLIQGNPETALVAPRSVILTKATARKYFGNEDPVGKEVMVFTSRAFTVTGVLDDPPGPTHWGDFPMIISWSTRGDRPEEHTWSSSLSYYTYILLKPGADRASVVEAMNASAERHMGDEMKQIGGYFRFDLLPVKDIYLKGHFDFDVFKTGSWTYLMQFGAVALFILIIAALNYVNLATARSTKRGRMVGVAKTLGATRGQLGRQFLFESVMTSLIAFVLALLLVELALPTFAHILGLPLHFNLAAAPVLSAILLALAIVVGLLAGLYPAAALTTFRPVDVIRGQLQTGRKGTRLRGVLVVLQFAISVVLLVGTLVILKQMDYIRNKDLGYDREQVVSVRLPNGELLRKHQAIQTELARIPGVVDASSAVQMPNYVTKNAVYHLPGTGEDQQFLLSEMDVGTHYIDMMGLHLLEGRSFDPTLSCDSTTALIVNQAAATKLGWGNPVGKVLEQKVSKDPVQYQELQVIGLVKDFHFQTLQNEIKPMVLRVQQQHPEYLFFRIAPDRVKEVLPEMKRVWASFSPGITLQYQFLDDLFDRDYRTELRLGQLFNAFTLLAIFVACLGLFALATFAAEQRTREIGIRKVLGAAEPELVWMLVLQFVKLVAIANVIAWPVAWLVMHRWLEGFAYRVALGPSFFLLAALLSVAIALITVGAQAIRAALTNPVIALRHE